MTIDQAADELRPFSKGQVLVLRVVMYASVLALLLFKFGATDDVFVGLASVVAYASALMAMGWHRQGMAVRRLQERIGRLEKEIEEMRGHVTGER